MVIPRNDSEVFEAELGEKNLMLAILIEAFRDAEEVSSIGYDCEQLRARERRRALRWISSDSYHGDERQGFSFLFCCDMLGFSPEKLRRMHKAKCDGKLCL